MLSPPRLQARRSNGHPGAVREGNLSSSGNGLLDSGAFGLERVWSRPLGSAYSAILVVDGRLTTAFSDGESDILVSLDASTGAELWRYRISDAYPGHDGADAGPLATPSVAGGVVYGLGARGELFAVSLRDGKERWRRDLVAGFGAVKPDFGFATAPTVVGESAGGRDRRPRRALDLGLRNRNRENALVGRGRSGQLSVPDGVGAGRGALVGLRSPIGA